MQKIFLSLALLLGFSLQGDYSGLCPAACGESEETAQNSEPVHYYVPDVEGKPHERLKLFFDKGILSVKNGPNGAEATLTNPNAHLTFCGDAPDKGPDDVWTFEVFTSLAEGNPNCQNLIGNRDLNKLRFLHEIVNRPTSGLSFVDVLRTDEHKDKFEAYIQDKAKMVVDGKQVVYGESYDSDLVLEMNFIMAQTMGAPDALKNFAKTSGIEGDYNVCMEYLNKMVGPNGLVRRYLKPAKLLRLDGNVLCAHGKISIKNFGYIPETRPGARDDIRIEIHTRKDLEVWVELLNQWMQDGIEAFYNGDMERAYSAIRYQEPPVVKRNEKTFWEGSNHESVIHERPWTDEYNLQPLCPEVAEVLARIGVDFVPFGHSPVGKRGSFLLDEEGLVEHKAIAVACDTSAENNPPCSSIVAFKESLGGIKRAQIITRCGSEEEDVADLAVPGMGATEMIDGEEYRRASERYFARWEQAKIKDKDGNEKLLEFGSASYKLAQEVFAAAKAAEAAQTA